MNIPAPTLDKSEQEVIKFPEVMEYFQMTGASDFILLVATQDMEEYTNFYRNKLTTLPNISTVQRSFVLAEAKSDTATRYEEMPCCMNA